MTGPPGGRGQANLLALAAALVVLTAAVGVALLVTGGTLATATGEPTERALATGLADRLVAADGPLADRQGRLDAAALASLNATTLRAMLPTGTDTEGSVRVQVRVRGGGGTATTLGGDPAGGTTVTRLVRVVTHEPVSRAVTVDGTETVTVPAAPWVQVRPRGNDTVRTVAVADRRVVRAPDGLEGRVRVALPDAGATTVRLETDTPGATIRVTVPETTVRVVRLEVTVDG